MGAFSSTDKTGGHSEDWLEKINLDLVDLNQEFSSNLGADRFFGRFSREEMVSYLQEAHIFEALEARGYKNTQLQLEILSEMDNRIFIRSARGELLVHMRLKMSDFQAKKWRESFRLVFIDWLLTQNVKLGKTKHPEKLLKGQEYPGLSIIAELTNFIRVLAKKMGAHGAFNVPEYFHDAVLFHRNFQFVDAEKEGVFRAILSQFRSLGLRKLSNLIHSGKVMKESTEIYTWSYGEMLSCTDTYLNNLVFSNDYFDKVQRVKDSSRFKIIE